MINPRYAVEPPADARTGPESLRSVRAGYVIRDQKERKQVATIWKGGPGELAAADVAERLARWMNKVDAA